jgi:hypothetical protein
MTKRFVGILLLAALLCGSADAQPKHWYTDWKWWAGEAVIGAAIAADAHSTSRGIGLGLTERNTWAFGPRPSNGRIAGVSLGYFAIQTTLHAAAWHVERNETNKYWNTAKYVGVPAAVAIINGHNAVRNYQLSESPKK